MDTPKRAYSVAEAAEALGISQWLVREEIRRGQMRCTRIGARIIIPAVVIDEILSAAALKEDFGASRSPMDVDKS